jgi:hypothetical protein
MGAFFEENGRVFRRKWARFSSVTMTTVSLSPFWCQERSFNKYTGFVTPSLTWKKYYVAENAFIMHIISVRRHIIRHLQKAIEQTWWSQTSSIRLLMALIPSVLMDHTKWWL